MVIMKLKEFIVEKKQRGVLWILWFLSDEIVFVAFVKTKIVQGERVDASMVSSIAPLHAKSCQIKQ